MELVRRDEIENSGDSHESYEGLAEERGLISVDGEYIVFGCGMILNPIGVFGVVLYFTSEEAAQNYIDLFYQNALYGATIQISRKTAAQ